MYDIHYMYAIYILYTTGPKKREKTEELDQVQIQVEPEQKCQKTSKSISTLK